MSLATTNEALADAGARAAALDLSRHVLAVAPAGSGKTGLLVQRMLAALATVDEAEQVVAITFTNKAAAEIRARVLKALQLAAGGVAPTAAHALQEYTLASAALRRAETRGWNLQANPERLRALTIDGLQAQIAAELPLLSGIGSRPRVVDDPQLLYEQALLALFAEVEEAHAPTALREAAALWLRTAGNRIDRLIAPLAELLARREQWIAAANPKFDWAAHEAEVLQALHLEHQQRLAAALGEDDTAELVELVREGSAQSEVLAWAVAIERWPAFGVEHAALHRALAGLLVTKDGKLRSPKGITAKQGFPPKTTNKERLLRLLTARADDTLLAEAAADLLALPPETMPQDLAQLRDALLTLLRHALAHLQVAMGERGETDFSEIAQAALRSLRPGGGYGEALLRRDAQLRHLLVDEMQDTSDSQLRLLEQLTLGWQPGDGRSLFLVGDPQQSIYAFRKAEVRLFLQLLRTQRLGQLPLHCVQLATNFRSDASVVDWFNLVFDYIFPRHEDELAGVVRYAASVAAAPERADAQTAVQVHRFDAGDEAGEAQAAAARAAALAASGASVAILVRARTHVGATLRALRKLGVNATCQDVDALAAVPAVRDVLAAARALWHPEDRLSWAVLLRAPFVGLSWADITALSVGRRDQPWPQRLQETPDFELSTEGRARRTRLLQALQSAQDDADRGATLAERVERLWTTLGGAACVDSATLGDVRRALRLLREHARGGGLEDARGFRRAVERLYAAPSGGDVQVMTVHKAKGLEFDHVLLVGCARKPNSGTQPLLYLSETPHGALLVPKPPEHWDSARAEASAALFTYVHKLHQRARQNETLRLLYVAVTRARRTLDLYLCADCDDDGVLKAPGDSFAKLLAPALGSMSVSASIPAKVDALATAADGALIITAEISAPPGPPRAPRLLLPFALPAEDVLFRPREQRSLRPSEAVLSAVDDKREDSDVYAQLVGTLFHQALEKISLDGFERWADGGATRAVALAAGFRRLGLPEPQVESAVARVLELVARTLASATGRWLLGPHAWARSEYALAGYRDGRWVSALLDRCFETDSGELWVVDYKAAARPVAANTIERYIADDSETYRPQLRLYAELLAAQRPGKPVRAALYFPEGDRLVEMTVG
ncbi:MAG: ATP-dependent helicase PcrA [Nevskia sp.]|nr:ATP-dependent helicase PcrA [Nevskia sp.]